MKKRLFIAINLPEEIKGKIEADIREFKQVIEANLRGKIRWLPPENWHLTITFLGYQPDDAIPAIIESLKSIAQNQTGNLRIDFDKISFGPIGKRPRMIWLVGTNETSKNLALLKNKLEDELVKNNVQFQREKRGLGAAHITLARFQVGQINLSEVKFPKIGQIVFEAESLDLMESHLKRAGADYEILFSISF